MFRVPGDFSVDGGTTSGRAGLSQVQSGTNMNVATAILLAGLLCTESVGGTVRERTLIAETVVYRARFSGASAEKIVYAPAQYPGIHNLDYAGYKLYRPNELAENIAIAMMVLSTTKTMAVSNYARTGTCWYDRPCDWEARCEVVEEEGRHTFYLCPDWKESE